MFLAVGNQPALPLATLVQMDDRAIKNLLEKLKDTSSGGDTEESAEGEADEADEQEDAAEPEETAESDQVAEDETLEELDTPATDEQPNAEPAADDPRFSLKMRAEEWARRACQVGNLVARPRGRATPESQLHYERALASKARQLVVKVVLPGEWYLVRWGGTRKGSGTFYTRPQLAIPTVHRTLRPLAYDPPLGTDGQARTPHDYVIELNKSTVPKGYKDYAFRLTIRHQDKDEQLEATANSELILADPPGNKTLRLIPVRWKAGQPINLYLESWSYTNFNWNNWVATELNGGLALPLLEKRIFGSKEEFALDFTVKGHPGLPGPPVDSPGEAPTINLIDLFKPGVSAGGPTSANGKTNPRDGGDAKAKDKAATTPLNPRDELK